MAMNRKQHTRMAPATDLAKAERQAQAQARRNGGSLEPQDSGRRAQEAPGWFRGARVRRP